MNHKARNLVSATAMVAASIALFTWAPTSASAGDLADKLDGKLVQRSGEKVVAAPDGSLADKKLVAFYYSAHWCPPCRTFTPKLSAFYDKASKDHPEFELVFVSSDKGATEMAEYMEWGKMNFPAIAFDKISETGIKEHGASGIPYLVVLDESGKEVIAKAAGEDWRSPAEALEELEALLDKS